MKNLDPTAEILGMAETNQVMLMTIATKAQMVTENWFVYMILADKRGRSCYLERVKLMYK